MNPYEAWLLKHLNANAEHREKNYFEAGLIDSFGIISLLDEIEQTFEIKFNETHFQDRRFVTIKGLGMIIEELKQGEAI